MVHVLEELPGFTAWAQRRASTRYTQRDFVRTNTLGLALTGGATWLVVTVLGLRYGLLTRRALIAAAVVGGVIHGGAVMRQVYFIGVPEP